MKMYLVAAIPQVCGGVRYLLDSDGLAAIENREAIRDGGWDAAKPEYIIDGDNGRLVAAYYPGRDVSREEWRAIHAAID